LRVPSKAKRSNAAGRKCRAEFARVLDIQTLDGASIPDGVAYSQHDSEFVYRVGEKVRAHDWCDDRWVECAPGIHFFITRAEAVAY